MEEHLPTGWGNWAEISLALLTGFTVFGEVLRRYLNDRITKHTAAVDTRLTSTKTELNNKLTAAAKEAESKVTAASVELIKKLARERSELEVIIARERNGLEAEIAELRDDLSEKIMAESRTVGEGLRAIREHTTQIELWVRDNLVRDADFKTAMASVNSNVKSLSDDMRRLLERLLDKKD